jgi:toxin ParE1/3/4
MFELVYRPSALADLDAIFDAIEPDSPRRAASFVADIRARCRSLCEHPMLGPSRGEIRPGLRILPMLGRVVVCYRISGSTIVIGRILYGGRDFDAVIKEDDGF